MGAPAVSVRSGAAKRRPRASAAAPARRVSTPSRRTRTTTTTTKRRTQTRSRATASKRRSRITPPGGMAMIPVHAVGGAAGAVGGMADSGLVIGMTRGRLWIGVLGVLLGGIVALNVWGLSLSASTTGTAAKIDELERKNTVLGAQIAKRSSSDRVQALAAGLGLHTPTPKAVNYIRIKPGDAKTAAARLNTGEISVLNGLPIAPAFADASLSAVVPEATAEPVATEAAPVEPVVAPAPVAATDPAAAPVAAPPPDPVIATTP